MTETSRRRFIGAAGAGAAAVGATAFAPGAAAAAQSRLHPDAAKTTVVAVVEGLRSDEVTLMVNEREVVVRDRDLANRLRNAARG